MKKNLKENDQLERKDVMVKERGKKIWVTILERGQGETRERTKIFFFFLNKVKVRKKKLRFL